MPSAAWRSPQACSRPSASSRTIARRTGSPTVRMIVARSSASRSGCRIFSASRTAEPTIAMIQLRKFHEVGNIEARPPQMRRTLSPRLAYALAASVIGLSLFASITPSPLYGIYSQLWDFSPAVLTLIYGTYAFGVLASLILAGRISDQVGRRPVLLTALGTLLVTTVLYMVADSVAWLFVARGLQGLATGLALAAASAALLDLHPRKDPAGVGLTNGVVSAGGIGLGMLVSATAVQLLPAPRVIPYVVLFTLFAIAFAGALLMPEPVTSRSRPRLTPQRPSVPPVVRRP